jgi:hypothetical protein
MSTSTTLIQPREIVNGGIVRGAPISERFDASLLGPHIKIAEIRFLRPLLCDDFYQELITKKAGRISNYNIDICPLEKAYPTDPNLEFLWTDYLLPFLSYCVLFQSLPHIGTQVGTNGIFKNANQYGENLGVDGITFLQDTVLSSIGILKEDLRRYLCENKQLFPAFCSDCNCSCNCGVDGCLECKKPKRYAPKLGIIFYNKE